MATKRIEYIDAMRGFTMLLVVFAHVETFGFFNFGHETTLGLLFQSFMMPLFFFTSGFVTYRMGKEWNRRTLAKESARRVRIQLTPTIVFGLLYTYICIHGSLVEFIQDPSKNGYWFTIVLLEILLLYYLVNHIVFAWKKREDQIMSAIILSVIAVVFFLMKLPFKIIPVLNTVGNVTSLHYTFLYLQFFVLGTIVSCWREKFFLLLSARWFSSLLILIYCILFYFRTFILGEIELSPLLFKISDTLLEAVVGYSGLLLVLMCFYKYQSSFTKDHRIGAALQFVGRRTLDIYMIHYFLLPKLSPIGTFLIHNPNPVLELVIGGALAAIIVAVCLVISQIIRTSDFLAHWLFGKKYETNLPDQLTV